MYFCGMIQRDLEKTVNQLRGKYSVIAITGPRQSGKTTLVRHMFKNIPYANLENIDIRTQAMDDPRGFLSNFPKGAVIDEAQRVPQLFSYIQGIVDENRTIQFVLTGSQNFLLLQSITQSLAGRVAILKLLPFSLSELSKEKIIFENYEDVLLKGLYPGIYDRDIEPSFFYPSYVNTYLERDIRDIKNIGNLNSFSKFIQLCAGRVGQLLNMSSIAIDAGISTNTAKAWLSVLEAGYIIYYLQPYHNNFNKRIVKTPKLYFYDTGLACSLLGIENAQQVKTHYAKGALFENLIINEFLKHKVHHGLRPSQYFWQNKAKQEIDLIVVSADKTIPYEIKSGMTMNDSFFSNLKLWQKLSGDEPGNLHVIYGGNNNLKTAKGNFISWRNLEF